MDPTTLALIELAKNFGIAAPLIAALIYLLWRSEKREQLASEERREMTDKHMSALTSIVTDNRLANAGMTNAMERLTAVVTEEITTQREARAHDREEHRSMLDAIGKATIRSREAS